MPSQIAVGLYADIYDLLQIYSKRFEKLPFLDCLVSRDNNKLETTVYRKPTHTDRLLDESSYNPTLHKVTTIKTLTRQAQLVCDTPDSLHDENRYTQKKCNIDFIRRNIY